MSPDTNRQVIRRLVEEVFNQHNLDLVDALIAPDYTDHAALPGQSQGRAVVRETAIRHREAFPDLRWVIHDLIAEEDRVALRWSAAGTHRGTYSGVPATGRHIAFGGLTMYRLRGGQVIDEWVAWDELGILRQMGVIGT